MRIKSKTDLVGLGKMAQRQLMMELERSTKSGKGAMKAFGNQICTYPPTNPAHILHAELFKRFGSYWEGGELASEVILPGHEVAFRYDFAIVSAKLFIEFDGYGSHRTLQAFKRDREKHRHALLNGWVTLPVSNTMVKEDVQSLIRDITKLYDIRHSDCGISLIKKGLTQCIVNSQ
jgi:hypothetical protein